VKAGRWVSTQPFRIASAEVAIQFWGKQACSRALSGHVPLGDRKGGQ